jgi:uncharacterized membrane protein
MKDFQRPFNRFIELDVLRGIAVIGMIIFHYFFLINYLDITAYTMYEGWWLVLARSVEILFLILVGVSLALSYKKNAIVGGLIKDWYKKQYKRAGVIFAYAMTVSLVTFIFIPQQIIIFGILHFISISIVLLVPFAGKKYIPLILAGIAYVLSTIIHNTFASQKALLIFGFDVGGGSSIDYFPLFPWISLVLFGIFLGNSLYKNYQGKLLFLNDKNIFLVLLSWAGRQSIIIYMLHIPFLFLFIFFLQFIGLL